MKLTKTPYSVILFFLKINEIDEFLRNKRKIEMGGMRDLLIWLLVGGPVKQV